jgi:hypothetical protein
VNEFRHRYAKGLMSPAVLLVEGVTEVRAIPVASEMCAAEVDDGTYRPLEVQGVALVDAEGKNNVPGLAEFFRGVGVRTFALVDQVDAALMAQIEAATDQAWQWSRDSLEELLCAEVPAAILRDWLVEAAGYDDYPRHVALPPPGAAEAGVRVAAQAVLDCRKSHGYAARLLRFCAPRDYPGELVELLSDIYDAMKAVEPAGAVEPDAEPDEDDGPP